MIQWEGPGGALFEFSVVGYEFPTITDGWDANWLTIQVHARSEGVEWTASSACILTWDLATLENWLEDLESDRAESWSGLEPDLTLRSLGLSRGRAVVAVELAFGLRNPKLSPTEEPARDVYTVKVPLPAVRDSRHEVRRWGASYLPRGEQGERSLTLIRQRRDAEVHGPGTR